MEQKHTGILRSYLSRMMGDRKMKLSEVIDLAGVNRNAASNIFYERDMGSMKLETFLRICDGLNITLADLLDYKPGKKKLSEVE